jgi:hypothetical protein
VRLALALVVLALSPPALSLEPLKCAKGTLAKSVTSDKSRIRTDWCEDTLTGKNHGPLRYVAPDGQVIALNEYRQGEQVTHQVTAHGLELMFAEVNAENTKNGDPWSATLINERAVRIDMTFAGTKPGEVSAEFRRSMLEGGPVCAFLYLDGANFQTLEVVAVNEKKQALATEKFSRADCPKPAAK